MSSDAPFNALSPAAAERLALLSEECGEVVQAVGKILRHGYESEHPHHFKIGTNREQLEHELGDLIATISLMIESGDVDEPSIIQHAEDAPRRKAPWLHHQEPIDGNPPLRGVDEDDEEEHHCDMTHREDGV